MLHQSTHTRISTIMYSKDSRATEDTQLVFYNGRQLTLMVADGASQRLKTTDSLKPLLSQYGPDTTPARLAASLARDVTAELAVAAPQADIRDIPLIANQRLREALESVYKTISSTAVMQEEPTLTRLQEDPRFVRLVLPICCITAARLDLIKGTLSYAHGGDTALFLLYQDGRTVQVTPDQMAQHDDKVRREVRRVLQEHQPKDESEYHALAANAVALNIYNGIYHNYEDEHGNTDTALGVGVINGLPQLEDYLVSETASLDDLDGILLTTDGMFWPWPLDETDMEARKRVNLMGDMIRQQGLKRYLQALHAEELADAGGQRYQHFAKLDDATAIYVRLSSE